jgi:hypothetical protein
VGEIAKLALFQDHRLVAVELLNVVKTGQQKTEFLPQKGFETLACSEAEGSVRRSVFIVTECLGFHILDRDEMDDRTQRRRGRG